MRHRLFTIASRSRGRKQQSPLASRSFSRLRSQSDRPSFDIAFDIGGVVLLGHTPIGGSPRALRRLYDDSAMADAGGGFSESKRAQDLGQLLGVNIQPLQVLCDILRTGGLPGKETGKQPHLFFANDDLEYQATFPAERLGMGALRIALEAIDNRIHPIPLAYTSYRKPNPFVYGNAETMLRNLMPSLLSNLDVENTTNSGIPCFKTLYMIGDNPKTDIRGARQAGDPWFSILTRTGVFKGKDNHSEFLADLVVDTVEDAVDFILRKECGS